MSEPGGKKTLLPNSAGTLKLRCRPTAVIILGSLVVLIVYYFPMLAIKGIAQAFASKTAPLRKEEPRTGIQS